MKYVKFLLLLAGICLLAAGCEEKEIQAPQVQNASEAETASEENEPEENGSEEAESEETAEPENLETEVAGPGKIWYGDWEVVSCAGKSAVYALSEEEIQNCIGTQLHYDEADLTTYRIVESSIDLTGAKIETKDMAPEDWDSLFRVRAQDLGIDHTVESVSLLVEGNIFGTYFMVLDDDTLLIPYEGVFFTAKRSGSEGTQIQVEAGEQPNADAYPGSWRGILYNRCVIHIESDDNVYYQIDIQWANSASETVHWKLTGQYDDTTEGIVYIGSCVEETVLADGETEENVRYSDGTGTLHIRSDGNLYWADDTEKDGEIRAFERE